VAANAARYNSGDAISRIAADNINARDGVTGRPESWVGPSKLGPYDVN
jgi:hypothetical protein